MGEDEVLTRALKERLSHKEHPQLVRQEYEQADQHDQEHISHAIPNVSGGRRLAKLGLKPLRSAPII